MKGKRTRRNWHKKSWRALHCWIPAANLVLRNAWQRPHPLLTSKKPFGKNPSVKLPRCLAAPPLEWVSQSPTKVSKMKDCSPLNRLAALSSWILVQDLLKIRIKPSSRIYCPRNDPFCRCHCNINASFPFYIDADTTRSSMSSRII